MSYDPSQSYPLEVLYIEPIRATLTFLETLRQEFRLSFEAGTFPDSSKQNFGLTWEYED